MRRTPLPAIGPADPQAVEYIRRAWKSIPDDAQFRRVGLPPIRLRDWIRQNGEAIRLQQPVRIAALAAVREATGVPFRRACGECGGDLDDNARLYDALVCGPCAVAGKSPARGDL